MKLARPFIFSALMLSAFVFVGIAGSPNSAGAGQAQTSAAPASPGFALTTSAFEDGAVIPAKYTHSVQNPVSPKLEWTNVPENTASFALIVHDLDVAIDKKTEDALHWLAFNIPGTDRQLPEAVPPSPQLPNGTVQLKIIRGMVGYFGPGAPPGHYHHYMFEIYALDTKLNLGPDATRTDVLKAMDGHILGKAVMSGRFHR